MPEVVVFGISTGFPELSRSEGQIAHVLLTRSPLVYSRRSLTARLACVKHAASVRPEPGSNSPLKSVDARPARGRPVHRLIGVSRQESPATETGHRRFLTKGPVDRYRDPDRSRSSQPADGALQLIRRLLAHC